SQGRRARAQALPARDRNTSGRGRPGRGHRQRVWPWAVGRFEALRKSEERGEIYSAMSSATPAPALAFAADEVAGEFTRWLAYLSTERRMSPKTVHPYQPDLPPLLP